VIVIELIWGFGALTYERLHDFDEGDDPVLRIRSQHFCVGDGPSESEAA
jgi:hypothetical protein